MKLLEILTPKKDKSKKSSAFLGKQIGPKLSVRDRVDLAQAVKHNQTPSFAKRQAESVEG